MAEIEDLFAITEDATDDFFSTEVKPKEDKVSDNEEVETDEESENLFETDIENLTPNKKTDENTNTSVNILTVLKEKGIISYEDSEIENLENEDEFIETKFDEAVESRVEELFQEVPEENKAVIQFLVKGGNINNLLNTLSKTEIFSEDLDIEKDTDQEKFLRGLMLQEGEPQEYIDSYIETLKESGRLDIIAKPKYNKWKAQADKEKEEALKISENNKAKEREAIKKAKFENAEFLKDKKDLGIIPLTVEDKKVLPSYMTEKNVVLQSGQKISQLHYDLFYKIMQNKTSAAQIALIVKSAKEDGTLSFERIEKAIKTKGTTEIKNELERAEKSKKPGNTNNVARGFSQKGLSDYF
jgi:hypothetical protein